MTLALHTGQLPSAWAQEPTADILTALQELARQAEQARTGRTR